ncbi:hypothetical protein DFP72DRAFT_1053425 [Ephemerocybe angulata]|uniref:Uncharacterized protein n=1 Tax=Ephemerocybe angulata TaxID=980116 RepID=A0A8H6HA01_9AGAR|nr:hypothetical protein DFP72DRAFT_1053425 [Tulosesus angulatus]
MRFISSTALTILSTILLSVSVRARPLPDIDNYPSLLASREPTLIDTPSLPQYTARDLSDIDLVERVNIVDKIGTHIMHGVDRVKAKFKSQKPPPQPAPKPAAPNPPAAPKPAAPPAAPKFVEHPRWPGQPAWWDVDRFGPLRCKPGYLMIRRKWSAENELGSRRFVTVLDQSLYSERYRRSWWLRVTKRTGISRRFSNEFTQSRRCYLSRSLLFLLRNVRAAIPPLAFAVLVREKQEPIDKYCTVVSHNTCHVFGRVGRMTIASPSSEARLGPLSTLFERFLANQRVRLSEEPLLGSSIDPRPSHHHKLHKFFRPLQLRNRGVVLDDLLGWYRLVGYLPTQHASQNPNDCNMSGPYGPTYLIKCPRPWPKSLHLGNVDLFFEEFSGMFSTEIIKTLALGFENGGEMWFGGGFSKRGGEVLEKGGELLPRPPPEFSHPPNLWRTTPTSSENQDRVPSKEITRRMDQFVFNGRFEDVGWTMDQPWTSACGVDHQRDLSYRASSRIGTLTRGFVVGMRYYATDLGGGKIREVDAAKRPPNRSLKGTGIAEADISVGKGNWSVVIVKFVGPRQPVPVGLVPLNHHIHRRLRPLHRQNRRQVHRDTRYLTETMEAIVPQEITAELTQILSNLVLGDNEVRAKCDTPPSSPPSPTSPPPSPPTNSTHVAKSNHAHMTEFLTALTPLCSTNPSLFAPHLPALLSFMPQLILPAVDCGPTPTGGRPLPSAARSAEESFVFPLPGEAG